MFSKDYLTFLELSNQLKVQENKVHLTPDHLIKFNEIFKSLASRSDLMSERIFKEFEHIIQNCDVSSSTNRAKLIHLSHLILNHFSSKSIVLILAIYKRVLNETQAITVSNTQADYRELVQKLLSSSQDVSRFTCVDLVKKASQTDSLSTQYKYAQTLVRLLTHHFSQNKSA